MGSLSKQLQKKLDKKKYKEQKKMFLDERRWQEYCKSIGHDVVENNLIGRKFLHFKDWIVNKDKFIKDLEGIEEEETNDIDLEWKEE